MVLLHASNALPARGSTRPVIREQGTFDRLFEEYADAIFGYALRLVGDRDRAADIAQDTFVKAYRSLETLTDPGTARAWLFRIASNTAIDEMRRRRWTRPFGSDAVRYAQRPDPRPGPEEQVMAAALDDRLQGALLQLKAPQRQCLLLSDLEGMAASEIGAVMNLSPGAVRTLLSRSRAEMRRLLAAEGMTR
jgi:RNA polymerase sigma-70 factor (ECF subfamily)